VSARRAATRVGWGVVVALPLVYVASPSLPLPALWRSLLYQFSYVTPFALAAIGAALARRRAKGSERRLWTYLALASAVLLANESNAAIRMLAGKGLDDASFVFCAVAGPIAGALYVALLLSMTRVSRASTLTKLRYALDLFLAAAAVAGVVFSLVVRPLLAPLNAPLLEQTMASAYAVIGLVVLVGMFTNIFGWKLTEWQPWEATLALGMSAYAIGVALWPYWYASAMYRHDWVSTAIEVLWTGGHAIIFAGTLQRLVAPARVRELPPAPVTRLSAVRPNAWLVPLATVLVAGVVVALHLPSGDHKVGIMIASSMATVLVCRSALLGWEASLDSRRRAVDLVTGLEGQRRLREHLAEELALAEHRSAVLTVIVFDIDELGRVNEMQGRDAGDALLRSVAGALCDAVPEGRAYRYGGDEFAAVLPAECAESAFRIALRTRWELEASIGVSLSAGIASFPEHGSSPERLLVAACGAAHSAWRGSGEHVLVHLRADAEDAPVFGAYVRMLRRLAATADEREGVLGHARMVAALAVVVARRLLLADDRVARVELAAELHDIGKVAASDALLRHSAAQMGAEDVGLLRDHPLIGSRMLASDDLRDIVPAVAAHHESWDGSGFPRGLSGEEIPLEARIIAVCDTYDRICRAHNEGEALAVLGQERGRRFDPVVVDEFFYALSEIEAMLAGPSISA